MNEEIKVQWKEAIRKSNEARIQSKALWLLVSRPWTFLHTCARTRTHTHTYIHSHKHTRTHTHSHTQTHRCSHVHTCTNIHISTHANTLTHTYTGPHYVWLNSCCSLPSPCSQEKFCSCHLVTVTTAVLLLFLGCGERERQITLEAGAQPGWKFLSPGRRLSDFLEGIL